MLPNDVISPTQEWLIAIHRIKCCQLTSGSKGYFVLVSATSLLLLLLWKAMNHSECILLIRTFTINSGDVPQKEIPLQLIAVTYPNRKELLTLTGKSPTWGPEWPHVGSLLLQHRLFNNAQVCYCMYSLS